MSNPAVDIKVVGEQPVQEQKPLAVEQPLESPVFPELQERAIGQALGFEKDSEYGQNQDNLQLLLKYAKSQTDDHSPESLKWVIRSLEMKLGSPPLSEKRITYLSRYVYLEMESKKIEKEKERFIRG